MLIGQQEVEVPTSVRQVNVDLSRTSRGRRPAEPPSPASTPHKPALRKTNSTLSPRKTTGKSVPVYVQSKWVYINSLSHSGITRVGFRVAEVHVNCKNALVCDMDTQNEFKYHDCCLCLKCLIPHHFLTVQDTL